MTLAYYKLKALSKGQTHYFWCPAPGNYYSEEVDKHQRDMNLRVISKQIKDYLNDPDAIAEQVDWHEWDAVPKKFKHKL